jgi:hypothetical protein
MIYSFSFEMKKGCLVSLSVACPSWFLVTIINNQVTIILHNEVMSVSTLVISIRAPSGLIVAVINDQVTIFLHSQMVRTVSFSVGAT